jgi:hypothetical protein
MNDKAPSVFDFTDYREFLRAFYEGRHGARRCYAKKAEPSVRTTSRASSFALYDLRGREVRARSGTSARPVGSTGANLYLQVRNRNGIRSIVKKTVLR